MRGRWWRWFTGACDELMIQVLKIATVASKCSHVMTAVLAFFVGLKEIGEIKALLCCSLADAEQVQVLTCKRMIEGMLCLFMSTVGVCTWFHKDLFWDLYNRPESNWDESEFDPSGPQSLAVVKVLKLQTTPYISRMSCK